MARQLLKGVWAARPVMDVSRAKAVPIVEVAVALGLVVQGRWVACPSHAVGDGVDAHPSCQLYASSNRFYCFACGNHGDAIDLVAQVRGQGFADAVAWLGGSTMPTQSALRATSGVSVPDRTTALRELLWACGAPSDEARAYWLGRGLSEAAVVEFGLTDVKRSTAALLGGGGSLETLVEAGVLSERGRLRFAEHRLLFPFWQDGVPVYLQGRRYGRAEPRYLGLPGVIPCLYNVAALAADEVWVAEGCMDTGTLASAGVAAVGLVGARGLKRAWVPLFAGKSVVLAFDNDGAGREATARELQRLQPYAAALHVADLPEGADVNAYFVEQRRAPATLAVRTEGVGRAVGGS